MMWLWLSAALMTVTALAHSALSETRLLPAITAVSLTRTIVRYALHAMSVYMILSAVTVAWPGSSPTLVAIVGAGWIVVGLTGLAVSRGRHRGWPVITAAGVSALIGALA